MSAEIIAHPKKKQEEEVDHRIMSASELEFVEPEPQDDIVPGLIPKRDVTLLAGCAGYGKTYLSQMLMSATAANKDWLGQQVRHCRSFMLLAEDRKEKVRERQQNINRHYGIDFGDLAEWATMMPNDDDNFTLFSCFRKFGDGTPRTLWHKIEEICGGNGDELIILDNVMNIFDGDSNSKRHVNSCIRWFNMRARILNAAIVLLCNPPANPTPDKPPSKYFSGTQVWEDSARNTLSLNLAHDRNGKKIDGQFVLKVEKGSYLPYSHPLKRRGIMLQWQDDVLVAQDHAEPAVLDQLGKLDLKARIVRAVKHGVDVLGWKFAADPQSPNYLPGKLAAQRQWQHISWGDIVWATDELLTDRQLIKVAVKDTWLIRTPDGQQYLGE